MEKRNFFLIYIMLIFWVTSILTQEDWWYKPTASLKDVKETLKKMEGNNPNEVPRIDVRDTTGITPLMSAAAFGRDSIKKVATLVAHGADINARSKNKVQYTPLHYACFNGNVDVAIFLLKKGANFLAYNTTYNPAVPHMFGVNLLGSNDAERFRQLIQAFTEQGANLNLPDKKNGETVLFWVLQRNQDELLKVLFKEFWHFIDFDFKNKNGKTILDLARKGLGPGTLIQNFDVIKLLESAKPRVLDGTVNVNDYDKKGFTYTMRAALKGYIDRLQALIARGANLNAKDRAKMGNTALHWACLYNQPKSVEILVNSGADTLITNKLGAQPINYVWGILDWDNKGKREGTRKKIIELFIKKGASINFQDKKGNTLLTHLAFWGAHDTIKQLLADFSDFINFKQKNKKNLTALDIAKNRKDAVLIRMLEPFYVKTPLSAINRLNKNGYSPLMVAALRDDVDEAKYLIRMGANVNLQGKGGNTALHLALQYRSLDVINFLLKDKNIDVTIKNEKGNMPLLDVVYLLTEQERQAITTKLLKKGADINATNKNGQNLISLAKARGQTAFVAYLQKDIGKIMQERIAIMAAQKKE